MHLAVDGNKLSVFILTQLQKKNKKPFNELSQEIWMS